MSKTHYKFMSVFNASKKCIYSSFLSLLFSSFFFFSFSFSFFFFFSGSFLVSFLSSALLEKLWMYCYHMQITHKQKRKKPKTYKNTHAKYALPLLFLLLFLFFFWVPKEKQHLSHRHITPLHFFLLSSPLSKDSQPCHQSPTMALKGRPKSNRHPGTPTEHAQVNRKQKLKRTE